MKRISSGGGKWRRVGLRPATMVTGREGEDGLEGKLQVGKERKEGATRTGLIAAPAFDRSTALDNTGQHGTSETRGTSLRPDPERRHGDRLASSLVRSAALVLLQAAFTSALAFLCLLVPFHSSVCSESSLSQPQPQPRPQPPPSPPLPHPSILLLLLLQLHP